MVPPRRREIRRRLTPAAIALGLVACAEDSAPRKDQPVRAQKVEAPAPPADPAPQARSAPLRGCRLPEGHPRFCAECGTCGHGQGGCSTASDCLDGLDCVAGAGEAFGYARATSVCVSGSCRKRLGERGYCDACGPCNEGEGDCRSDSDCATGLVCKSGGGDRYGLPGRDVCAPDPCDTTIGSSDYCGECGPCPEGIGDCDSNDECMPGLVCVANRGDHSGYKRTVDVCEVASPRNRRTAGGNELTDDGPIAPAVRAMAKAVAPPSAPAASKQSDCRVKVGNSNYCRDCGPCPHGIGDCDSADECQPGHRCANNAGAEFGMAERVDVCVRR